MRAMWSGSLTFGLVNIPVKLYSATEEQTPRFDFLHEKDLSPIRYAKFCRGEGEEVKDEEIVKGFEYKKGEYVVMSDEDFQRVSPERTRAIEIVSFAAEDEIDSRYFEKPYYLEPDRGADKAYALLREALRRSGKVGIAKYVLRNRERLAAIKPEGEALTLNQLRFDAEVRKPEGLKLPPAEQAAEREVELALMLVKQLSEPFRPEQYRDEYSEQLMEIIEQKAEGRVLAPVAEAPEPEKVIDIMAALKASLEEVEAKAS
ncbi:MAG: Ku protein [Armatimonadota bacterium]|nr:Ku protein [Armatimonadota bacterium]